MSWRPATCKMTNEIKILSNCKILPYFAKMVGTWKATKTCQIMFWFPLTCLLSLPAFPLGSLIQLSRGKLSEQRQEVMRKSFKQFRLWNPSPGSMPSFTCQTNLHSETDTKKLHLYKENVMLNIYYKWTNKMLFVYYENAEEAGDEEHLVLSTQCSNSSCTCCFSLLVSSEAPILYSLLATSISTHSQSHG